MAAETSSGETAPGMGGRESGGLNCGPGTVEVRFLPSERRLSVEAGTSLLEAARRAQLPIASACGAGGVCANCALEILEGGHLQPEETQRERTIKARNRVDPKLRLACRVPVAAGLTATASYW